MALEYSSKIEAVDSCVLLRVLENDLPEQSEKARNLLLSGKDLYVDDAVILEVVYVMNKDGYNRQEIIEKMRILLLNTMFVYDRRFFEPVFEDYLKFPALSFEDLVIAKRVQEKKCAPLWTFDKKLARQARVAKLVE